MIHFLPLQQINASFEPELSAAVQRVVRSGWYLRGEETRCFEAEFARYIGVRHVVGVGNGLDALTLALQAAAQKQAWAPGSEVIVPAMTFVATAEAVLRAGFVPRFADVDDRALLTPETAEAVVSERTRAIVPVHLYGHPAPMTDLMAWAAERGLFVLEDAAQAHGAQIDGRNVGSWGHAAAFSFYPGKNLGALGDGGAVATADGELAERVRLLANYGAREKYVHEVAGVNSRLDELQAAALRVKLRRLDADNEARRGVARRYAEKICNPCVSLPYGGDAAQSVFHIYPLRSPHRDALMRHLAAHHVETLIHYPIALPDQPALRAVAAPFSPSAPVARQWAAEELSLPISPLLTERETDAVADAINSFQP